MLWPKLHRAFELRDELNAWSHENASGPQYETRSNSADASNPLVLMEWRVERGSLPDYERAALLLGDVVHNWRAALDHQMWAVTPTAQQERRATQIQFPIYHKSRDYRNWLGKWRNVYGAAVLAVLEDAQPCNVPAGEIHPLGLMQILSNRDKHRMLAVVSHVAVDLGPVSVEPEPLGGVQWAAWEGPVEDETVLATLTFARPIDGSGHEVEVRPNVRIRATGVHHGPNDRQRRLACPW
jgi:hypothetical protein